MDIYTCSIKEINSLIHLYNRQLCSHLLYRLSCPPSGCPEIFSIAVKRSLRMPVVHTHTHSLCTRHFIFILILHCRPWRAPEGYLAMCPYNCSSAVVAVFNEQQSYLCCMGCVGVQSGGQLQTFRETLLLLCLMNNSPICVAWVVLVCSLVGSYRRFGRTLFLSRCDAVQSSTQMQTFRKTLLLLCLMNDSPICVAWVVLVCSLVGSYRRFGKTLFLSRCDAVYVDADVSGDSAACTYLP